MGAWFVIGGIVAIAALLVAIGVTLQNAYDDYRRSRNW